MKKINNYQELLLHRDEFYNKLKLRTEIIKKVL